MVLSCKLQDFQQYPQSLSTRSQQQHCFSVLTIEDVSRHCQMFLAGQNHPQLRNNKQDSVVLALRQTNNKEDRIHKHVTSMRSIDLQQKHQGKSMKQIKSSSKRHQKIQINIWGKKNLIFYFTRHIKMSSFMSDRPKHKMKTVELLKGNMGKLFS